MRKVLLTCAVVAGLFIVGTIVSGIVISSYFKSKFPDVDNIDTMRAELHQRFGEPDAFAPPLDGHLPLDRIEVFVALRESLATRRDTAGRDFASFVRHAKESESTQRSRLEKVGNTLRMARGGADMVSGMLGYFGSRERMLLDRSMGEGEFAYWYFLTTFAWLDWQPLSNTEWVGTFDQLGLRSEVEDQLAELQRLFKRQLRNARRELEADSTRTADENRMLALVVGELEADQAEHGAPFGSRFPSQWAAALEPYRGRLAAALPGEPGAVFLDLAPYGSESNHFRFEWNSRGSHRHRL